MIPISTPLIFPKVIPNDWDEWHGIWNKYKKLVTKTEPTRNPGAVLWLGFDIYVKDGIDANDLIKYQCENINCPDLFNSLFDNLDKMPIDVHVVRVLQSMSAVHSHHDHPAGSNMSSIRSLLFDDNPRQTWYYENENKQYLRLPEETNTWWYDDELTKHGTEFIRGYNKQLIMYRGAPKPDLLDTLLNDSMKQYSDYVIYI